MFKTKTTKLEDFRKVESRDGPDIRPANNIYRISEKMISGENAGYPAHPEKLVNNKLWSSPIVDASNFVG